MAAKTQHNTQPSFTHKAPAVAHRMRADILFSHNFCNIYTMRRRHACAGVAFEPFSSTLRCLYTVASSVSVSWMGSLLWSCIDFWWQAFSYNSPDIYIHPVCSLWNDDYVTECVDRAIERSAERRRRWRDDGDTRRVSSTMRSVRNVRFSRFIESHHWRSTRTKPPTRNSTTRVFCVGCAPASCHTSVCWRGAALWFLISCRTRTSVGQQPFGASLNAYASYP